MRIAVGQLWQETNTFNPVPTTRRDFDEFGVCRGAELVEKMAHTNELGGFIQSLRSWPTPPNIIGLVRLPAWPSGTATAETFDWLKSELMNSIEASGNLDAVLLALHGSMAAVDHPDVEGEILEETRRRLNAMSTGARHIPLVATLDLHANITQKMVNAADALVLYHTMPHVDIFSTGQRGARVLQRILDGAKPTTSYLKIPAVFPAERANTESPGSFAAIRKSRLIELERDPRFLTAGIATVQPWLDIPDLSSAVVITTDNDPGLARTTCEAVADSLWATRTRYLPELHSIEDAVQKAFHLEKGLTVLSDAADATTSGAPGDSVWLLRELQKYPWDRPVLVTIVNPELVSKLAGVAIGQTIECEVGGIRDNRFGIRIPFTGRVERVFEASFELSGHIGNRLPIDMGRSLVLRQGNIVLIVTSRTGPHFAPELFRSAGFDPYEAAVVVAKSPCGFRAVYEKHATQIFSVKAPGCAPSNFWEYPYHYLTHPIWPWDDFEYQRG